MWHEQNLSGTFFPPGALGPMNTEFRKLVTCFKIESTSVEGNKYICIFIPNIAIYG